MQLCCTTSNVSPHAVLRCSSSSIGNKRTRDYYLLESVVRARACVHALSIHTIYNVNLQFCINTTRETRALKPAKPTNQRPNPTHTFNRNAFNIRWLPLLGKWVTTEAAECKNIIPYIIWSCWWCARAGHAGIFQFKT